MKKGKIYGEQNEDRIRLIKWHVMISSVSSYTDHLIAIESKNRKGEDIAKPPAIIHYNAAKKGIDVSDQMSSYVQHLFEKNHQMV